jgi:hypothetical protein
MMVRLHPLSAEVHDQVVRYLCEELTPSETFFYGVDLRAGTGRGLAPSNVASGRPAATASASHIAASSADSAIRTTLATPTSAKRLPSLAAMSSGAAVSFLKRAAASRSTTSMARGTLGR